MRQLKAAAVRVLLSCFCSLILLSAAYARAEPPDQKPFDISPQVLAAALSDFARQSGREILYTPEVVADRRSNELRGLHEPIAGLKVLLKDSGLEFTTTPSGAILIGPPVSGSPASSTSPSATSAPNTTSDEMATPRDERSFWDRFRLAQAPAGNAAANASPRSADSALRQTQIEEIIVTAQKREELLIDVPISVAVVDAKGLVARNELRVEDYIYKLPGVSLALVGNAGEPQIVLRGMANGAGGNPTAGVVIDEVPYTRSRGLFLNSVPDVDPGDLAHIEVLRGPQGTLYGASNIGGLLKYVTVDPSIDAFSGQVSIGSTQVRYGDDLGYSVRGSANIPLGDALALRLSGFTLNAPGYIDNPQAGERDVNDRDAKGARLAMLWQPAESTSVKVGAIVQESNRNGMAEIDRSLGADPKRSFRAGTGIYDRETQLYSVTVTSSLGPVEFVSATGYGTEESTSVLDLTSLFPSGFANVAFPGTSDIVNSATIEDEKFTQEFRAEIPLGERVRWLAGVFYTEESNTYDLTISAITPPNQPGGLFVRNADRPGTDYEERAVFTNLTVDITDRVDVQFGGRYSENDQVENRAGVPFGFNPVNAPFTTNQRLVADGNSFTYLVTPRFKISPDHMAYARFATGYRPGGSNINCGIAAVPCQFDEDTSTNYELGLKGSPFDHAFTFDVAIYHIEWDDMQTGGLVPAGGGFGITYTDNVGKARSQGAEFSISTELFSSLSLSLSGAYNDTELLDDLPGGAGARSQLPFGAPWSGSFFAQQEFSLDAWNGASFLIGASASYMGERSATFRAPGAPAEMPGYTKFDFNFALKAKEWSVDLFANNIADKRGVLAYSGILPGSVTYIEPRTIGLTLSRQF